LMIFSGAATPSSVVNLSMTDPGVPELSCANPAALGF